MARLNPSLAKGIDFTDLETNILHLEDGITAPLAIVGVGQIFIDSADGDLKIIFGNGVTKTIVVDT